jgi:hypothetical protein
MWHTKADFNEGVNPTGSLTLGNAWKLWNYRSHERSIAYMTGTSAIFSLAQVWQTRMAIDGIKTHTIDCAIRFNTYAIAEEALRLQIPPESIHDQITVTRAFTPYQILDAVQELKKNEVVFVLAPAKQFFDGDVAFDEGLFLIQKLVRFLADAHERGVALFVVEKPSYAAPAFSTFLSDIRPITDKSRWELYRLGDENAYRLKLMSEGRLRNDIFSLPAPKPHTNERMRPIRYQPSSSQMQFAFT